jgi:hypothetical protein
MSVEQTHEKGPAVSVGSDAWFDVLDAAGNALHNMQYPLRELELPPYPAGGTCGCANLGKALSHIVAAQEAIRDLEKQLGQWCAMNESAHGSSSNTAVRHGAQAPLSGPTGSAPSPKL